MSKMTRTRTAARRKSDFVATKSEATAPGASVADTAHDQTAPDALVSHLVRHARALASLVLTHAARLTYAKVSAADADALTAAASERTARTPCASSRSRVVTSWTARAPRSPRAA